MDERSAKLALARQKLKDHQQKKSLSTQNGANIVSQVQNTPVPQNAPSPQDPHSFSALTQNQPNTVNINNDTQNHVIPFQHKFTQSNETLTEDHVEKKDIPKANEPDLNVTEILISNKRSLENQVTELKSKLDKLEQMYTVSLNNNKISQQHIRNFENEYKKLQTNCLMLAKDLQSKDNEILNLKIERTNLTEQTSNLLEQLEFTKSILSSKESENTSLNNQLATLQKQYEFMELQLQQLNNGVINVNDTRNVSAEENEILLQKISSLEQQIKSLQKERDETNIHYEHYVNDLNDQLKSVISKNAELSFEVQRLSDRENSLIEQIGDMEIRLQNYQAAKASLQQATAVEDDKSEIVEELTQLKNKYEKVLADLLESKTANAELIKKYEEIEKELNKMKTIECTHDNISLTKLQEDIASDKVAAQIATEQNKKLKTDVKELEEAFVKMSKDKLELTEKLTAEKFLNRELTIKLAEVEEKAKEMQTTVSAKDQEMMRLLSICRSLEQRIETLNHSGAGDGPITDHDNHYHNQEIHDHHHHEQNDHHDHHHDHDENHGHHHHDNHEKHDHHHEQHTDDNHDYKDECTHNHHDNDFQNHAKTHNHNEKVDKCEHEHINSQNMLPQEAAMQKLQDRFLKIMGDVADLSDEKHRLEHIILQLQNETDTICEYVALYQQQRSLLKKRDEERNAQIKIFQTECDSLKKQLEELTGILVRFAEDTELTTYFEKTAKKEEIEKVMNLLSKLKSSSLVDPHKSFDMSKLYPCSCCSGNEVIDV